MAKLSASVEDVFASGNLPQAAETLAQMRRCLAVVGEVCHPYSILLLKSFSITSLIFVLCSLAMIRVVYTLERFSFFYCLRRRLFGCFVNADETVRCFCN